MSLIFLSLHQQEEFKELIILTPLKAAKSLIWKETTFYQFSLKGGGGWQLLHVQLIEKNHIDCEKEHAMRAEKISVEERKAYSHFF